MIGVALAMVAGRGWQALRERGKAAHAKKLSDRRAFASVVVPLLPPPDLTSGNGRRCIGQDQPSGTGEPAE